MRYLCQVWLDGRVIDAMPEPERVALNAESLAYDRGLQARGHFIAADALQSPETAVTVRVRGGRIATTIGPFIESGEHLGGFILVEARDLNEAIAIAAGIPIARFASVEVRPVLEFDTGAAA